MACIDRTMVDWKLVRGLTLGRYHCEDHDLALHVPPLHISADNLDFLSIRWHIILANSTIRLKLAREETFSSPF